MWAVLDEQAVNEVVRTVIDRSRSFLQRAKHVIRLVKSSDNLFGEDLEDGEWVKWWDGT